MAFLVRLPQSGINSSTYLPDISSQGQVPAGHKDKEAGGHVYEWDKPLPPATLHKRKSTRPNPPKLHRTSNKHHCDYSKFIKKGMARHIPVSVVDSGVSFRSIIIVN